MSDFQSAVTGFFPVRDEDAFFAAMESFDLEVIEGDGGFAVTGSEGWPTVVDVRDEEIDFVEDVLVKHIAVGATAQARSVIATFDGDPYVGGDSVVFTSEGVIARVDLSDAWESVTAR